MAAARQPLRFAPFIMSGEHDLSTAMGLGSDLRAYAATTEGDVVVDCSRLTFIDSSAIAQLLKVRRSVVESGRRFRLEGVSATPLAAFTVLGLLEHFGISAD
jgi:anti-sigma B factor antagonist